MEYRIEDNRIFKLNEQNEVVTELRFIPMSSESVNINFVYVNPDYRGQGLATDVMEFAVSYFKEKKYNIKASCPFAKRWLEEHK